jgi:hypothetical protein
VTVLLGLVEEGVGLIGIAGGDGSVGCAAGVAAEATASCGCSPAAPQPPHLRAGPRDVGAGEPRGRCLTALGEILLSPRRRSRWLRQTLRGAVTVCLAQPAVLAHDGEVREVSGEVTFRSRPRARRALVPPTEGR